MTGGFTLPYSQPLNSPYINPPFMKKIESKELTVLPKRIVGSFDKVAETDLIAVVKSMDDAKREIDRKNAQKLFPSTKYVEFGAIFLVD